MKYFKKSGKGKASIFALIEEYLLCIHSDHIIYSKVFNLSDVDIKSLGLKEISEKKFDQMLKKYGFRKFIQLCFEHNLNLDSKF